MRRLIIVLDHLPDPQLNPNRLRSLHFSVRSEVFRVAREEVGWLAKSQWGDNEPMVKARISYEFLIKQRRLYDIDNLLASCKPYTDGLIDAGVILYDDIKHLELGQCSATYDVKDRTTITIEEFLK